MKSASKSGLAVVTGAAGGLGASFANKLAQRGYHLLLVDRRLSQLEQVCESLSTQYGVKAEPYSADFCNRAEVERLAERLAPMTDLELLVNNAGFGTIDHFVDTDAKLLMGMVDVHVAAPMMLTHAVLPGMLNRNSGAIINVSSLSAWFHSAGNAHYGSTKICLAVFSMALAEELRGTNVRVQALCPGFVRTGFHSAASMKGFERCSPAAHMWSSADEVAECSLRRLSSRQSVVIPGWGYRIVGRLARFPVLQPIMQRIARVPRGASQLVKVAEVYVEPCPESNSEPCAEAALSVEGMKS